MRVIFVFLVIVAVAGMSAFPQSSARMAKTFVANLIPPNQIKESLTIAARLLNKSSSSKYERIAFGEETSIEQYPSTASLLRSFNGVAWAQVCGGTIINNRSVLTAARCIVRNLMLDPVQRWRIRVGSTTANSGGVVYTAALLIPHPSYYQLASFDHDFALVRVSSTIIYSNIVQPASIAGTNYNVPDNSAVWTTGWGDIEWSGSYSEVLRHVQVWTVNQQICRNRYAVIGHTVTDHMVCSAWIGALGRDQCQGDAGGPLFHNNVVVGVYSWSSGCGGLEYPGVYSRVSSATTWIVNNA